MNNTKVKNKTALFQYGFMAIPLSFAGLPLYIYAPDFYAVEAGLSLTLIGTIIMAIRIFDAIQDPFIGWISQTFLQLRLPIMIAALGLMGISFIMLFHPPENITALWFILSLIVATTAFSVLSINLNAIGSLWSKDTHEKTQITTWREGLGLIGLLIAALLPGFFNLQIFSYILCGLLILSAFIFLSWHKNNALAVQEQKNNIKKNDIKILFHPQNIWFYSIFTLSMMASAIPAVLVLFFIRDHLNAEIYTGLFLLLYFLSGALGMPLWQKISQITGKHKAWMFAMALGIFSFIWAVFLKEGDIFQYSVICFLSGFALGAELALPPSLLSDQIDQQKNRNQTALYFAAMAFLSKSSLAIGSGIAFLILGFSTFTPGTQNETQALTSLTLTYAALPCVIKLMAACALFIWLNHNKKEFYHENFSNPHPDRSHNVS